VEIYDCYFVKMAAILGGHFEGEGTKIQLGIQQFWNQHTQIW